MYLQSLASAFPKACYTQRECWSIAKSSPFLGQLSRRSAKILETVLSGSSGIDTRHFAVPTGKLFSADAEELNKAFEELAPPLAVSALGRACEAAKVEVRSIDALLVCTCTGYLCPGVSSHLAEQIGIRGDAFLNDMTGLGCGAAIPTMHAASCFLAAHPDATVATVAVEICSAAFYLDNDTGVIVSACLFGDGASAALWQAADSGGQWKAANFRSIHLPEEREKIRFVNAGGRLKNQLHRAVPEVAAEAVEILFSACDPKPDQIIAHAGGRDVIEAIEERLPGYALAETRETFRKYGNLSSPSVLCALEERLSRANGDKLLWLTSFGAGFAAHCCDLTRGSMER
jgi:predicted naringenin-chalcone synthase